MRRWFVSCLAVVRHPPIRPLASRRPGVAGMAGLWLLAMLLLGGCSLFATGDTDTDEQKAACGQQCLQNGEVCSQYFARRNEDQRRLFEQAKENYWLCLRKFPGAESRPDGPCLAPPPPEETFDSCGQQLDECLTDCQTSLDDLADTLERLRRRPPARPEAAPDAASGSGSSEQTAE